VNSILEYYILILSYIDKELLILILFGIIFTLLMCIKETIFKKIKVRKTNVKKENE